MSRVIDHYRYQGQQSAPNRDLLGAIYLVYLKKIKGGDLSYAQQCITESSKILNEYKDILYRIKELSLFV